MAAASTILALAAVTASAASTVSTLRQKPPVAPSMPKGPDAPKPADDAEETRKSMSLLTATAQIPGSQAGRASTLLAPIGTAPQRKTLLGQ